MRPILVHALKAALNGQPLPMQTQSANFPNSTGFCRNCGQVDSILPPFGLETSMPNGAKTQTPSAAAASLVPNLNLSYFSRFAGADGSTQPRTGRHQGVEA
eukprot:6162125-Amphidinium_carterae.1